MLFPDSVSEKLGISNYMSTGNSDKTVLLCDDCRPCLGLGLPPHNIITYSVKRRQLAEPVCVIVSHAHLFVSSYCFAFSQDFSFKSEIDESHLVRDQDCMADGVDALPTKSCTLVLRCHHRVWSRIVIQQRNARYEKSRPLFSKRLFQFRQGVTLPRSIDGYNLQKVQEKVNSSSVYKALRFPAVFLEVYQAV
ncbi:hypothetical protein TNCV_4825131 [Trichonephila clavipes]|uniref:Uncharacterized protein n=1 Tax=Trichonephila clavipes TaxID=2585209 RepID=A0A8X6RI92_TRICX|nr:hypothetical protein TNCV_4825131 [Trichonephila clavipes]